MFRIREEGILDKVYRDGAIGALMDEYERASEELAAVIKKLSQSEFEKILDQETADEDCRSVQTIINHVIRSGYGYANSIRRVTNQSETKHAVQTGSPEESLAQFDKMLKYTV